MIGILRTGGHVPPVVIDNAAIAEWSGVDEEWIRSRTGVFERRYGENGTAASDLAYAACLDLLGADPAGWPRISGIIVATSTGDQPQPATAAILQDKLGLYGVPAFDVNAVCAGYLFALNTAAGLLDRGLDRDGAVLVVGVDMYSRILDRRDVRTVSLFGDGAGATLVGVVPEGYGITASRLTTDGRLHPLVGVRGGGSARPLDPGAWEAGEQFFRMDGRAVRDYVVSALPKLIEQVLGECGLAPRDLDRVVFHQANMRMIEAFIDALGVDCARVPVTAPRYGNTGAASIPITLHEAHLERPLRRGETILLAGVGGGISSGATVVKWY